jgi:hypothetical protein
MRRLALLVLAAPLILSTPALAQEPATAPPMPMAAHAHQMTPPASAGQGCGAMDPSCGAMLARMDSVNAQLAALTEKMDKATGSKKVEAMGAVIDAMVRDRLEMASMMTKMHAHMQQMMGGMSGMGGMNHMGGMGADSTGCAMPATAPTPAPKE